MQSLNDIMLKKNFDEPPEIQAVKDFVERHYKTEVGVSVRGPQLIIASPSAALAGTLRMHIRELQELAGLERRVIIRIVQ